MGCYCGLGTRNAKLRWALAAVLGLISAACLIAFAGLVGKCASDINDAEDANPNDPCVREFRDNEFDRDGVSETCSDQYPECRQGGIVFWIFVIFAVLASIPCYAMCCCASKPKKHHDVAMAVPHAQQAQYGSAPADYQAYGTAQPGYGTAQPGYGNAQPGHVATGYASDANGKPVQYGAAV